MQGRHSRGWCHFWASSTATLGFAISSPLIIAAEPLKPDLGDLVVIQPDADAAGRPNVSVSADKKVEIATAMHIHRLYYSGDREFQGPIIAGGPTTVVARHPRTGTQLHINVVLPPGTPLISYDSDSITYVYPEHRVRIRFCTHCVDKCDKCKGKYHVDFLDGEGLDRTLRDQKTETKKSVKSIAGKSKLLHAAHEQLTQRKNVAKGAIGLVDDAGAAVVDKMGQIFSVVPFVAPLESLGKQSAERGAVEEVRRAGLKQQKEATEYVRTIR